MAGVKQGDIVIEFDKIPIRTTDEFEMRVRRAIPYSTINLVVMRGNEKVTIPVKMGRSG
jgi:S1-C subfamily serine protease